MDLKHVIPQQRRRTYGPSFDIAFSTDKSNVSRVGPTPVFSRASSGTFVNENRRIVGKTRSTTSLNPANVPVGGVAVFAVPSGSVVGWLNNSVVVVMEDTDGDDQIGAQRHVTGTLIHKTNTAITLLVTSKVGTTTLSSWFVSYRGLRNDHNPVTGLCLGALIEESRTNLITSSNAFNAWATGNCTVAASSVVTPEGTADAWKIVEDSLTATHSITRPFTPVSGTTYTASVWIKSAENGFAFLGFSGGGSPATFISVNLSTGSVSTALGTPIGATSVGHSNGWWRVSFSLVSTSSLSPNIDIRLSRDGNWANRSYLGNGVNGMYVYGAQLEAGSFATSYIPTTAAAAIRSADAYGVSGTDFSRFYNQTEGTMFIQGDPSRMPAALGGFRTFAVFSSGSYATQVMSVAKNSNQGRVQAFINASGFNVINDLNPFKIAIGVRTGDNAAASNGSIAASSTTTILSANRLDFRDPTLLAAGQPTGTIASFKYFPRRLSNAQLQALTAIISDTIVYNGVAIWYNGVGLIETT